MLRFDRFKFRFIYYYFIFIHLFRYYPLFRLVFVQIRDEIIQAADQLVSVQFILIHYFNVLQCYNAMLCCQIVYLTNFGANYSRIRCSQELTDYKRAIEMEEDNSSRANLGIIIIIIIISPSERTSKHFGGYGNRTRFLALRASVLSIGLLYILPRLVMKKNNHLHHRLIVSQTVTTSMELQLSWLISCHDRSNYYVFADVLRYIHFCYK